MKYVMEELNIRSVVPCNDPLKYASLRAEPDFRYLFILDFIPCIGIHSCINLLFNNLIFFFGKCIGQTAWKGYGDCC